MNTIRIKSPAKINLGLRILNKREDGYHNIQTLFYPIILLYDELIFTKSSNTCFLSDLNDPIDFNDNLIIKAKNELDKFSNQKIECEIKLSKKIPIGAGLGGGSSNAAATLIALNKLFDLNLSYEILSDIALKLGSDVPFFLLAQPAIGKSRGEILEKINIKIPFPICIINPGIHISTKELFSQIDPINIENDYSHLDFKLPKKIKELQDLIINDFEEIVFNKYAEIKSVHDSLLKSGALFSKMTGTGSTVYGVFENIEKAEKAIAKFPRHYFTFISIP